MTTTAPPIPARHRDRTCGRRLIWLAEIELTAAELRRRGALRVADELEAVARERMENRRDFPTAVYFRPSRLSAQVLGDVLADVRAGVLEGGR
jgi:hypothetical protein